jgi:hypothetical protein
MSPRGPLSARRMSAHWVVLAAAALTTLVAAAVGAALAVFAGQALPQAVKHDLVIAPGTAMVVSGTFAGGTPAQTSAALRSTIAGTLDDVPFGFWQGVWSDPLGFEAGSLPAKPTSLGAADTPLLQAASLQGVTDHAVLVSGRWPSQLAASSGASAATGAGGPIPAALPASTAALLKLRPGDVLHVVDRSSDAPLTFLLTGLYAERQTSGSAASYWQLNSVPASGSATASGFTTYGPLVVSPSAFPGQLTVGTGTWVAQPDMADFTANHLSAISASAGVIGATSLLSGLTLTTNLPAVLANTGDNVAVARSLLGISALELLVLTVAALLAVARLLAAQREGETALLTARGATKWQLTRLTAAEVIPLSLVTAAVGGIAGIWLARVLGSTLYSSSTADGAPAGGISLHASGTWLDALYAALAIAVLSIAALLYPVLRPGRGAAQVRRGRQAVLSGATRAGADLALIALAVLACWQLRRYSAVTTSASGPSAIDPVLVLAPALALAGGTVLTLRLLPAAARVVDRVSAAGRGLTSALAGWQFSRQPLRQGGAALLLVMAVGTGTLALAQHQSWTRSAADQAAYVTGGDARVDLTVPLSPGATSTISRAPGVRAAMAVSVNSVATPAEVVAIDAAQAPKVALLRADQSSLPPTALLRSITPTSPTGGQLISGRPKAVQFTVTLSRAPLDSVTAEFTVTDATGAAFQLSSGLFTADGRPHVLTASLGGTDAAYPLRLTQVTLFYTLPAKKRLNTPVTLTVAGATSSTWDAVASSPELDDQLNDGQIYGPSGNPQVTGWQSAHGGATLTFTPGYGLWAANPFGHPVLTEPLAGQVSLSAPVAVPAAVPAIATRAFDSANNTHVGTIVQTTVSGVTVPAKIVAVANAFPTISGAGLVMDLPTLEAFLVSHDTEPVGVNQWWLSTANGQVPASLARAVPPGAAITSNAALAAATVGDPLSAAPQQVLLAMAVAAALLAISGFWVSIAANVRQRRAENALLAALGVNQRSAAVQLFLEKLLLSVPAAALGLILGSVVASLLVPAVTLSPTAQIPVPPPVTLFDLGQTVPLAIAVAVLPALAAALVIFRRPDPAAELRAADVA